MVRSDTFPNYNAGTYVFTVKGQDGWALNLAWRFQAEASYIIKIDRFSMLSHYGVMNEIIQSTRCDIRLLEAAELVAITNNTPEATAKGPQQAVKCLAEMDVIKLGADAWQQLTWELDHPSPIF